MYVCMTVYHVCSVHKGQTGRGHPSPGTGVNSHLCAPRQALGTKPGPSSGVVHGVNC